MKLLILTGIDWDWLEFIMGLPNILTNLIYLGITFGFRFPPSMSTWCLLMEVYQENIELCMGFVLPLRVDDWSTQLLGMCIGPDMTTGFWRRCTFCDSSQRAAFPIWQRSFWSPPVPSFSDLAEAIALATALGHHDLRHDPALRAPRLLGLQWPTTSSSTARWSSSALAGWILGVPLHLLPGDPRALRLGDLVWTTCPTARWSSSTSAGWLSTNH